MIVTTKAGYDMWPGPYGEWGSRKYLLASLDQSLKRMGLEYVDIFYSHRQTPTRRWKKRWRGRPRRPQRQGALHGHLELSPAETMRAAKILRELGTPCLIHQTTLLHAGSLG